MFNHIKEKREAGRQKKAKQIVSDNLFAAVTNNDLAQVVRIIDEHGKDPEIINSTKTDSMLRQHKCHGKTVLIHAVRVGNPEIVRAILKAPCINVNMRDDELRAELPSCRQHNNALLSAVNHKKLEIVEILAAREDVNVNAVAHGGESPLICAVENFPAAVPVLLRVTGINVNAQNDEGKTALHFACLRRNPMSPVMPQYLLELLNHDSTKLDIKDKEGNTPLSYAHKRGDSLLYDALMRKGAVVEANPVVKAANLRM